MAEEKWLVMIYLAGDNNLSEECVYALTELKKTFNNRIKIFAQYDPIGSKIPVHRYEINRGKSPNVGGPSNTPQTGSKAGSPEKLAKDIVAFENGPHKYPHANAASRRPVAAGTAIEEPDTGSPEALFDFISWSTDQFKADRNLLILAGHGSGTQQDYLLKDENPKSSLSIPQFRQVFEAVRDVIKIKIDILGLDVCLMSMAEICFELNGLVDYMVASESYSPRAGWPYQQILSALGTELDKNGVADPAEVAKSIVREYTRFYSDYVVSGLSVDQSVIKVSGSPALAAKVKALAGVLKNELNQKPFCDAIVLAHWEAQSYNGEQFVDLYDFCDLLGQRYGLNGVPTACTAVMDEIRNSVVLLSCFDGIKYQYSYGLSIYFPWAEVAPYYKELTFATGSDWNDFLETYVERTRRKPRGDMTRVFFSEKLFRKTTGHGPDEDTAILSMRNPPQELAHVPECIEDPTEFINTFKEINFR
ncbi:MAG TPA: clostripain-related cysteine peptidase [Pyrinomonadaceae bacterium]|nr:clostripain-related cysteine peptidase [Pyrinomonadaceae bacterium]